jgi:molybdate transport system ATP-binding protein
VLKADVAVDRRDFTVRAAIAVAPGERLALFGPSGAGKTTLLEVIAGLVLPQNGTIELAGRILTRTSKPRVAVPPWQRRIGLLRQDPGLFPHLSVRANLTYAWTTRRSGIITVTGAETSTGVGARRGADLGEGAAGAELTEVADTLGISSLLAAMPARLSGGQQHRAALARLLLAHCDALLLDEPYSGLDAALRRTLTALVVRLVTQRNVPAILVAHELADAQAFATQLAVIDHGRLLQTGPPDRVVLRPASVRVAELTGYLGFAAVPDQPGTVAGIHPDRVVAGAAPGRGLVLTGPVAASRPAGAGWEADIRLPGARPPGSTVTVRLAARPGPDGSEVTVTAIDAPVFGPDGLALAGTSGPGRENEVRDDAAGVDTAGEHKAREDRTGEDRANDPAFEHIGEGNGR